jgi:DNA-binding transcriptional LysR family regulator
VNLRQIRYFLAIADEGSFTRAAQRLAIAQPSLSQQVRALEHELGGPLLERLSSGIRLTPAGKAFLPEARAALAHADRAEQAARTTLGLDGGELEIATVTSLAVGLLPPALQRWHEQHPDTTVRLREFRHRRLLHEAMRDGVGDVAVGPRPPDWSGPVQRLGWEEFVIVLPRSEQLGARTGRLKLEDLADRDWVLFEPGHGLQDIAQQVCGRAGFVPRAAVRTGQVAAAAQFAAAGLGPLLIGSYALPPGLDATIRGLRPPLVRELTAYTRTAWSPATTAFLEMLGELPLRTRPRGAEVVGSSG